MTTMAAVLWDMPGVTDVHSSLDVYTHLFLCFLYSDRPNWLLLFICLPLHTASVLAGFYTSFRSHHAWPRPGGLYFQHHS